MMGFKLSKNKNKMSTSNNNNIDTNKNIMGKNKKPEFS
jgi:hypothetical protein